MKPNEKNANGPGESQSKQGSCCHPKMMGMGMMKEMMENMGTGNESPMAMMQKMMGETEGPEESEARNPMQKMMGMCMGMCSEMLFAINKTTSMAALATPELRSLFDEWMESLEYEALTVMDKHDDMDVEALAAALKISEESTIHLVAHMARKGKAVLGVRKFKGK